MCQRTTYYLTSQPVNWRSNYVLGRASYFVQEENEQSYKRTHVQDGMADDPKPQNESHSSSSVRERGYFMDCVLIFVIGRSEKNTELCVSVQVLELNVVGSHLRFFTQENPAGSFSVLLSHSLPFSSSAKSDKNFKANSGLGLVLLCVCISQLSQLSK